MKTLETTNSPVVVSQHHTGTIKVSFYQRKANKVKSESVKHTPGPWQTMNSHKEGFQNIVSLGDDQPQNRKWICEIGPSDTKWQDATLIASAPELLVACLAAQREFRLLGKAGVDFSKAHLDSAIAKAEGNL